VRDLVPPFASFWGEPTHRVTREFSERPPPPQVVVVRPLSGPPIPREDPPALALDLTPGPPPVSDWPTIEVGGLEEADEETILGEVGEVGAEAAPVGRAVALPPRSPPSQMHRPDTLPSVIVDVDVEFAPLVERLVANPADERAEAELLRQGQHAMAAIMARFPGPILLSRAGVEEGKARVTEYGPILRVIAGQRRVALPFVLAEANAPDPERRFWGTFLLSELAYPEAVPTIVARLVDAEERTRSVARLAARVVGESARDALVEELDRIVRDPQAANDQRIAILETLGVLRDAAVVPVLLSALSGSGDLVDQAARQALSLVARQDFGFDTRRWLAWWSTNSSRHRVEWLIDALTHEQAGIRKAAAEELGAVTREYFGYYEDLPRRERERAQQRYVEWWRSEGHARFGWG
jgi:HEAT repeat protein